MKLRFLGHAAFEITLEDGKRIVFDPYESGSFDGALAYGPIEGEYDLAIVSHDHADHCSARVTSRARRVVDGAGEFDFEGIRITTVPTFHDESKGSERGKNLISVIEAEDMRIAHLGDLGHPLSEEEAGAIEGVDVLLVPVGGYFTIDAAAAARIIERVRPRIAVPMHFKTPKVDFPIEPVDRFIDMMDNVEHTGGSEVILAKETMPESSTVVVLDPAL